MARFGFPGQGIIASLGRFQIAELQMVGSVQRATNTPVTIASEMRKGERPSVTSLTGASAAPSHAPTASPHITPRTCKDRADVPAA